MVERPPKLVDWVRSCFQEKVFELIEPEDWFERGHDLLKGGSYDPQGFWRPVVKHGVFFWSPPPRAAEAAIEKLRKARIKHQDSFHVFMVPRLIGLEWHKQVHKASDFMI
jgi:hypothetical protein